MSLSYIWNFPHKKNLKPISSPSRKLWSYQVTTTGCILFLSLSVQVLYLIPVKKVEERKVQKKRVEKTKSCEKKSEDQLVYVHKCWKFFSYQVSNQFTIFVWCKFWLGLIATLESQSYSLFASNLKFLCACVWSIYIVHILWSALGRELLVWIVI